jgi:hypothetical protein
MTRFGYTLTVLLGASLGVAACTDSIDPSSPTTPTDPTQSGSTSGSDGTTFDHDNNGISVWDLLDRLTKEGPPSFSAQVHGCTKPRVATLGHILASVGINVANTANLSAGQLYTSGAAALSAPNYAARVKEGLAVTISAASREFDIFAAGATEIINSVPNLLRCKDANGTPAQLFDTSTPPKCVASGLACILGVPPTQDHLDLCNKTITSASTPQIGQRLAVAVMMAAATTCE